MSAFDKYLTINEPANTKVNNVLFLNSMTVGVEIDYTNLIELRTDQFKNQHDQIKIN